jgi:hypothetical protein
MDLLSAPGDFLTDGRVQWGSATGAALSTLLLNCSADFLENSLLILG